MELFAHVTPVEFPSFLIFLAIGFLAGVLFSWIWNKSGSSDS